MEQYWGKYRGEVLDNEDSIGIGRLQVAVPAVLGGLTVWAMPCVPFAGPNVGFAFAPPIGAGIWVEFEGGDPDYPIWTGCYWRVGERPAAAADPKLSVLKTTSLELVFDDAQGVIRLTIGNVGGSAATVQSGPEGLVVTAVRQ